MTDDQPGSPANQALTAILRSNVLAKVIHLSANDLDTHPLELHTRMDKCWQDDVNILIVVNI